MSIRPLKNPIHKQAVAYMTAAFKVKKVFTQKEVSKKFNLPLSTVRFLVMEHCNLSSEDIRPTLTGHIRQMIKEDPRIYSVDEIREREGGSNFKDRPDTAILTSLYHVLKKEGVLISEPMDAEMTFKEIGLELKISEQTVRKYYKSALIKMNQSLKCRNIGFNDLFA